jgi:D-serine deaminase-like pyridoxal phosphate-dependent protein
LKELEMVLQAGANKAILAFPQVQKRKVERLCDLASRHPDAWIAALVSSPLHLELLASAVDRHRQPLRVMLDLDAGQHRTGTDFGTGAIALYRRVDEHPLLQPAGIHWYDGHDNFSDELRRRARAESHIESLRDIKRRLEAEGLPVPGIVAGSSWSFPYYARAEGMQGSPGTFVYWDTGFASVMPDMPFRCAALVLTQVVDRFSNEGLFTTDLGCKGISSDLPEEERAVLLGYESATLVLHSEEHGVFRFDGELPEIGDYLLAVPGHICPTTIRYPGIHVIDAAGEVVDYFLHTARDRE